MILVVLDRRTEDYTEYTGFIVNNGFLYQLNWELANNAGVSDRHVRDLMLAQAEADFEDTEYIKQISDTSADLLDQWIALAIDLGWSLRKDLSDRW